MEFEAQKALAQLDVSLTSFAVGYPSAAAEYIARKAELDERWQEEMLPLINDMYWYPFRNGISIAPEDPDELRSWLSEQFDDAEILVLLMLLLQRYQLEAYNLGGYTALRFLGYRQSFDLTDPELRANLDQWAMDLVTQGTPYSLVDTTIDDLVVAVPAARESENNTRLMLAAYITLRAAQRNESIERSERPRQVANAQDETYTRNGISYKMYDVLGIGCPKICEPWHGLVYEVGQFATLIPQHPRCDCGWTPVQFDGETVGTPPVTVRLPGLEPWTPPLSLWTGQPIRDVR